MARTQHAVRTKEGRQEGSLLLGRGEGQERQLRGGDIRAKSGGKAILSKGSKGIRGIGRTLSGKWEGVN